MMREKQIVLDRRKCKNTNVSTIIFIQGSMMILQKVVEYEERYTVLKLSDE